MNYIEVNLCRLWIINSLVNIVAEFDSFDHLRKKIVDCRVKKFLSKRQKE